MVGPRVVSRRRAIPKRRLLPPHSALIPSPPSRAFVVGPADSSLGTCHRRKPDLIQADAPAPPRLPASRPQFLAGPTRRRSGETTARFLPRVRRGKDRSDAHPVASGLRDYACGRGGAALAGGRGDR